MSKENLIQQIENNSSESFGDDFQEFNRERKDRHMNGSSQEKQIEIVISDICVRDDQPME